MAQIRLEPANPLDVRPEELEDLAETIQALDPSYEVRVSPGEALRGVGVTWWEVVNCYVPWKEITGAAAAGVTATITDWLRERFKKEPTRPKVVTIYGPREQVLKTIALRGPDEEPQDSTTDPPPARRTRRRARKE